MQGLKRLLQAGLVALCVNGMIIAREYTKEEMKEHINKVENTLKELENTLKEVETIKQMLFDNAKKQDLSLKKWQSFVNQLEQKYAK